MWLHSTNYAIQFFVFPNHDIREPLIVSYIAIVTAVAKTRNLFVHDLNDIGYYVCKQGIY